MIGHCTKANQCFHLGLQCTSRLLGVDTTANAQHSLLQLIVFRLWLLMVVLLLNSVDVVLVVAAAAPAAAAPTAGAGSAASMLLQHEWQATATHHTIAQDEHI